MSDIIDRIDALVDEQLSSYGNRSGYDFNVNQEKCRCGRDWHGMPLTRAIQRMRNLGEFEPDYKLSEDDSEILCVGSTVPGPWRSFGASGASGAFGGIWAINTEVQMTRTDVPVPMRALTYWPNPFLPPVIDRVDEILAPLYGGVTVRRGFTASFTVVDEMAGWWYDESPPLGVPDEDEAEPETPQQRALPRPSTTPPMWANDPTRSRRPRRNRNQPNRQGTS